MCLLSNDSLQINLKLYPLSLVLLSSTSWFITASISEGIKPKWRSSILLVIVESHNLRRTLWNWHTRLSFLTTVLSCSLFGLRSGSRHLTILCAYKRQNSAHPTSFQQKRNTFTSTQQNNYYCYVFFLFLFICLFGLLPKQAQAGTKDPGGP